MQRFFAFAVSIIAIFGIVPSVLAQVLPSDPNAPLLINTPTIEPVDSAPPAAEALPKLSIVSAVAAGRELLAPVLADFKNKEAKVKPLASKTGQTAAAIAVWNKTADTVTVLGGTRGANYFTPDNGGPAIRKVSSAGSQTAYRDNDPNLVVVGTVQADMVAMTVKKKKVYKPSFAYYVPYNSELYSTETLAAGSDYLSNLIQEAFNELDAKGITSRAFPGQALTAVIDPYLIKSIAVIEHADSQIYADDASEEALGRFLVKLALNQEGALNTALSTAGARGMVQFIPSTYKLMVTKRPDLALIPDFVKGMADHGNAIKAEAAYLDMILADLPQSIRDKYAADKGSAASYIAAGYNGGSTRVKKAILVWGDDWSVSHATDYSQLTNKAASLKSRIAQIDKKLKTSLTSAQKKSLSAERSKAVADRNAALASAAKIKNTWIVAETAGYVVKLRRVYNMLAAGFFATPNAPANTVPVAVAPVPDTSASVAMSSAPAATNP
jgi:hypothetical protein